MISILIFSTRLSGFRVHVYIKKIKKELNIYHLKHEILSQYILRRLYEVLQHEDLKVR